ncbi:DNA-processing protein DprA [Sphingobacteriaceae bacterium WQ 2009]|uniref:DNA-processing protein DprA n=1 Tax=Rhinopithecimicrobium faecis TaxID=2820698 RepID=A0A8T4H7P7_9SPHI|nr:DNA-processing protein DprA [Sphingobacteriaceae bacterium WQ 2009]
MQRIYQIALSKMKGIGPTLTRQLMQHCGTLEGVFKASKQQLLQIPQIGPSTIQTLQEGNYLKLAERELQQIEKMAIQCHWYTEATYPHRLAACSDAPLLLYTKGNTDLNPTYTVAIVGTRRATAYGARICEELLAAFKALNIQIVSGLAFGIDSIAHRQALKHQLPTIAVLAHGLDRIYPYAHHQLAKDMLSQGGLVTEFPLGTPPERVHFPMRNRIIAGMVDLLIVVEAAENGGALITAELANGYGREVCAFPGAVDQHYSAGCNYLIKSHRAQLVRDAADILYLMNWGSVSQQGSKQLNLMPPNLDPQAELVYSFIPKDKVIGIQQLAQLTGLTAHQLAVNLINLEMLSLILTFPGKNYRAL